MVSSGNPIGIGKGLNLIGILVLPGDASDLRGVVVQVLNGFSGLGKDLDGVGVINTLSNCAANSHGRVGVGGSLIDHGGPLVKYFSVGKES